MTKQKKALIISAIVIILLVIALIFIFVILPLFKSNTFDIKNIEIYLNGKNVGNGIDKEFTESYFTFNVVINNDDDINKDKPKIEWAIISENNLNCKINNEGKFSIGDTLGTLKVQVSVTSNNTLSATTNVNIIASDEFTLHNIEANYRDLSFIEGQTFNSNGLKVRANFFNKNNESFRVYVTDYDYDGKTKLNLLISQTDIAYAHMGVERIDTVYFVVIPKTLKSIEITKVPKKINYVEGQFFDANGLEVTAHYEYIHEVVSDYIINEDGQPLSPSKNTISITYVANNISKTTNQRLIITSRTLQSIEIISQPAKLNYIQGQTLNLAGLNVLAHYEFFDRDITDEVEIKISNSNKAKINNSNRLCFGDDEIIIFYKENEKVDSRLISISVNKPYKELRTIVFENPFDATLRWIYEYDTDDGISKADNTEVFGELLFDSANGIYNAPVGATITIMRINPAVTGFVIDGKSYELTYPENSIDFELKAGDDINIKFNKVSGDRITVRFAGIEREPNWAFIYSSNWNSPMTADDLRKIAQIYEDNNSYYYEYTIGEKVYTFSGLSTVDITTDTLIKVKRIARTEPQKIITINVMYGNVQMTVAINKTESLDLSILPQILKVGYSLGFSPEKDGQLLTNAKFAEWLNDANNEDFLYAVYTLNAELQSGDIIGVWRREVSEPAGSGTLVIEIKFKAEGTYDYIVLINGEENCKFTGVYTFSNNIVTILSVESDMEYQLVSVANFNETPIKLDKNNGTLTTRLFIIIGLSVGYGQLEGLVKQ